jgi:hypothetical protein
MRKPHAPPQLLPCALQGHGLLLPTLSSPRSSRSYIHTYMPSTTADSLYYLTSIFTPPSVQFTGYPLPHT